MNIDLLHGDCLEILKELPDNSIDSVVTDPPYGISFMGKKWDYEVPSIEIWKEVLRVLKPGGHLLSFGGCKTYHRMVCNIEDAGFEPREFLCWMFGSGFPKSMDISKAIDKQAGAEREIVGQRDGGASKLMEERPWNQDEKYDKKINITVPSTPEAKQWEGWGTALKPAFEPIIMARKPVSEKTIAENVLRWGVGGINIEECRVGNELVENGRAGRKTKSGGIMFEGLASVGYIEKQGRFPANIILDEEAGALLDAQSGVLKSGSIVPLTKEMSSNIFGKYAHANINAFSASEGGASRFFYCAKTSQKERNQGLAEFETKKVSDGRTTVNDTAFQRDAKERHNTHPTVKPLSLMKYLITLVTPKGGVVLDPFMGSGSTGIAAKVLGFDFIGMERELEYIKIAEARINSFEEGNND